MKTYDLYSARIDGTGNITNRESMTGRTGGITADDLDIKTAVLDILNDHGQLAEYYDFAANAKIIGEPGPDHQAEHNGTLYYWEQV